MSDDGQQGLALIAMLGAPFSPAYARARRAPGSADPLAHAAANVALYGLRRHDWALTERTEAQVERSGDRLVIGTCSLEWDEGGLVVRFDERPVPFGRRIAGEVRIRPAHAPGEPLALDDGGRHLWWPVAPVATAEVTLHEPAGKFTGSAYVDFQLGTEPLEDAFTAWNWSRVRAGDEGAVFFDLQPRGAPARTLARRFDAQGAHEIASPALTALPTTWWRLRRRAHSEGTARVIRSLEDGPFYARALVETTIDGQPRTAVHETLNLDRFTRPWVQFMLPYKTRRDAP